MAEKEEVPGSDELDDEVIDLEAEDEGESGEPKAAGEGEKPEKPAARAPKPTVTADEGIEVLKSNLEAEKRARQEAEERASKFDREASDGQVSFLDSQISQVANAHRAISSDVELLKREMQEAFQTGDGAKLAETQFKLSKAASEISQLEQGHAGLREQREKAVQAARQRAAQPQVQQNPVEAMADAVARAGSPRSAAWIRAHPDVATSEKRGLEVRLAHHAAMEAGFVPDSDGYFDYVEKRMGYKPETPARPARTPTVAAPVSRAASPGSPGEPVRLTRAQVQAASDLNMSKREYAKHLQNSIKKGRPFGREMAS